MKRLTAIIGGAALTGMLALGVAAQTQPAKTMTSKHTAKAAPKSDAEIQADIQKRLAGSAKLKSENINVSVMGGVATFNGMVKSSSSKGGVNGLAKAAGAKSVVNNLTVEKAAKPAKKP